MMIQTKQSLINKYNVPGPRYTSYPTVPLWNEDSVNGDIWTNSIHHSIKDFGKHISLYIHLPFCESMCTFCGCHKHITKQHSNESPYISALIKEWKLYLDILPSDVIIDEIHLGGGTPTFFSPENLRYLIEEILKSRQISEDKEFSFEGHPNNTSRDHLDTLYSLGFTRVSFGIQDYAPHVQKVINRIQSFDTVKKVHQEAQSIGYESISHDLVFGLPKQTISNIMSTISNTLKLMPDRISLYSYAHVPWIKGLGQRGYSEDDLPHPDTKRKMYEIAKSELIKAGYVEIGMDHFALKTDSLHKVMSSGNLHRNFMGYTTTPNKLMIGLGMSSISDSWYAFAQNEKKLSDYYARIERYELPIFRGHLLSDEDLIIRRHILDLMCNFETELSVFIKTHPLFPVIVSQLKEMELDNILEFDGDNVRIHPSGVPFVRNVCMSFDLSLQQTKLERPTFSKTI